MANENNNSKETKKADFSIIKKDSDTIIKHLIQEPKITPESLVRGSQPKDNMASTTTSSPKKSDVSDSDN